MRDRGVMTHLSRTNLSLSVHRRLAGRHVDMSLMILLYGDLSHLCHSPMYNFSLVGDSSTSLCVLITLSSSALAYNYYISNTLCGIDQFAASRFQNESYHE